MCLLTVFLPLNISYVSRKPTFCNIRKIIKISHEYQNLTGKIINLRRGGHDFIDLKGKVLAVQAEGLMGAWAFIRSIREVEAGESWGFTGHSSLI